MSNEHTITTEKEIDEAYRCILGVLKASKICHIDYPEEYIEVWPYQRIPPLESFPHIPKTPTLPQKSGIPITIKEAKTRLLDFIKAEIEIFCIEDEDDIQNIMGYYNNFEEGMTYQLMTPQEYIQYAFEEILRMRNSRKVLY
jgi:hypothetical protein